jgi:hypothetical protein
MVVTGHSLLCAAIMAEGEGSVGTASEHDLEQDSLEVRSERVDMF